MRRAAPMLALLLAPAMAAAQTAPGSAPAPEDATITVTGQRLDRDAARALASQLVKMLPPLPMAGQYARWNTPVCPIAAGIDAALALRVADKLRDVAAAAGVPVAPRPCKTNIVISFTDNAAAAAKRIVERRPVVLAGMAAGDRDAIVKGALPVRWWHGLRIESPDGRPATTSSSIGVAAVGSGEAPTQIGNSETLFTDGFSASLIDTHIRISAVATTVLVDVNLATGYKLDAIAAYVAMAVLSQASLRQKADPALSILGLFNAGEARPEDLTPYDRALLSAIYKAPTNRAGRTQRGAIAARIVDQLTAARD